MILKIKLTIIKETINSIYSSEISNIDPAYKEAYLFTLTDNFISIYDGKSINDIFFEDENRELVLSKISESNRQSSLSEKEHSDDKSDKSDKFNELNNTMYYNDNSELNEYYDNFYN